MGLSRQDVLVKLIDLLQAEFNVKLKEDSNLQNELKMDSADMIRIISLVETEFSVEFDFMTQPPETLADVVNLITKKIESSNGSL